MASAPTPALLVEPRAMISPLVDVLSVGGLSVVVTAFLLAFARAPFQESVPELVVYGLTAAITWPHFLASYRLLYATKERVLAYRSASLYFPLLLAVYGVFAVVRAESTLIHVHTLSLVASVYLARHYTGQTWGMMASFSHVDGVPFAARERRFCQLSLDLVMLWHGTWAVAQTIGAVSPSLEPLARRIDAHVDPLAFGAFGLGLLGLLGMARRTSALPPARIVLPFFALFGWYALIRRDPTSIVVAQLAHALQYLLFPLRIEENHRAPSPTRVSAARAVAWLLGLVVVSLAVFAGIPTLFRYCFSGSGGKGDVASAFTAVFVSFINIHHYFVDSCLYKLRNPAVRRELFAHLAPQGG